MRTAFIATILIALLVFTHAETLDRAKIRGLGRKISVSNLFEAMKKNDFGNTLVNMLSLKFKTSQGQLSGLSNLLEELKEHVEEQQDADDEAFQQTSESLQTLIKGRQGVIEDAQSNIAQQTSQTNDNQNALNQASVQRASAQQEQNGLTQAKANLVERQTKGDAAYEEGLESQQGLAAGIIKTITLFETQQQNQDLNQQSVAKILDLLRGLQTAFEQSISEATTSQANADAAFTTESNTIDTRLEILSGSIDELNGTVSQLQTNLAQLKERSDAENQRLATATQLLNEYLAEQTEKTNTYNTNRSTRNDQLKLIALVLQKINEVPSEVQDILNSK